MCIRMSRLKTGKEGVYSKNQSKKEAIDIQVSLISENNHENEYFFHQNTTTFFGKLCVNISISFC